ncbi:MAG: hypothetical protein P1V20_21095 [Verrucomicrobiales bacterium]|nr:hypothetical protein [Verrucomicrobiales bacterium]
MNRWLFFSALLPLLITGCDRLPDIETDTNRNFLLGTWIMDREKTMEALTESLIGERESLAGKMAAVAVQKTAEKLITPFDNVKYTFTETEYSEKVGNYDGQKKTYEIIARPGRNTIKTKDEDGIVNVYHLDGLNIWYHLRDQQKLKIYLRASN